jgi:hypothetical protein
VSCLAIVVYVLKLAKRFVTATERIATAVERSVPTHGTSPTN